MSDRFTDAERRRWRRNDQGRWRRADTGALMFIFFILCTVLLWGYAACAGGVRAQEQQGAVGATDSAAGFYPADGGSTPPQPATQRRVTIAEVAQWRTAEPVEMKLVDETECAPGWRRVSLSYGWVVYYPLVSRGTFFPNWISEAQLRAAHTVDGRLDEAALDETKARLREAPRVVCHWDPLSLRGDPA